MSFFIVVGKNVYFCYQKCIKKSIKSSVFINLFTLLLIGYRQCSNYVKALRGCLRGFELCQRFKQGQHILLTLEQHFNPEMLS